MAIDTAHCGKHAGHRTEKQGIRLPSGCPSFFLIQSASLPPPLSLPIHKVFLSPVSCHLHSSVSRGCQCLLPAICEQNHSQILPTFVHITLPVHNMTLVQYNMTLVQHNMTLVQHKTTQHNMTLVQHNMTLVQHKTTQHNMTLVQHNMTLVQHKTTQHKSRDSFLTPRHHVL